MKSRAFAIVALMLWVTRPGSANGPPPLVLAWQVDVSRGHGLCVGDFGPGGQPAALVTDEDNLLTVVSAAGKKVRTFQIPADTDQIEAGHLGPGKPVLLGFRSWGPAVTVVDGQGHKLWSVLCPLGVDSAHWADLDQNGKDELVVGLNGEGGLRVLNGDGKLRWEHTDMGNVLSQALVKSNGKTLILATNARGDIWKLDPKGTLEVPIRPDGLSIAPIAAADFAGKPQILAEGDEVGALTQLQGKKSWVVGADVDGQVKWRRETSDQLWTWRVPRVVWGDVIGRGANSWAFFSKLDVLSIVNSAGRDIASLRCENVERMAILPRPHQPGLVLLLAKGVLSAYSLPRSP